MREEEFEIGGRYASKFTKLSSRNQKTSPQRREDSHRQAPWHGRPARGKRLWGKTKDPEGVQQESPGRKPWVQGPALQRALKGRRREVRLNPR